MLIKIKGTKQEYKNYEFYIFCPSGFEKYNQCIYCIDIESLYTVALNNDIEDCDFIHVKYDGDNLIYKSASEFNLFAGEAPLYDSNGYLSNKTKDNAIKELYNTLSFYSIRTVIKNN